MNVTLVLSIHLWLIRMCAFHQHGTLFGSLDNHCVCPVRVLRLRSVSETHSVCFQHLPEPEPCGFSERP